MLQRPLLCALIVALVAFATVGCASPKRHESQDGRAVVVHSPDRAADGMVARDSLRSLGFRVHVEPEGPPVRTSSVVAVYDVGRHPGRVSAVEDALAPIGGIESRPFVQSGPDGTDVVVWLVARSREAALPTPLPEALPRD